MAKTIQEINEKIREGKAVVYTAEEILGVLKKKRLKQTAVEVDRSNMTVTFDRELCIVCELCLNSCAYRAIEMALD